MDNPNNRELTFEEAVNAISEQNDDGGFEPREIEPPKNDTFGIAYQKLVKT